MREFDKQNSPAYDDSHIEELRITQSFKRNGLVHVHADIYDLTADEAEKLMIDLGQKYGCKIDKE